MKDLVPESSIRIGKHEILRSAQDDKLFFCPVTVNFKKLLTSKTDF